MFVVLAQATSSAANFKYPSGEVHSALLFISCTTSEEACRAAASELELHGWVDPLIRKTGEVDPEFLNGKEAALRDAYEAAVRDGASLIVYQDVDDGYAA